MKTMLKDGVSSASVEVRLLERSRMRADGTFNEIPDGPDAYGHAASTSPSIFGPGSVLMKHDLSYDILVLDAANLKDIQSMILLAHGALCGENLLMCVDITEDMARAGPAVYRHCRTTHPICTDVHRRGGRRIALQACYIPGSWSILRESERRGAGDSSSSLQTRVGMWSYDGPVTIPLHHMGD